MNHRTKIPAVVAALALTAAGCAGASDTGAEQFDQTSEPLEAEQEHQAVAEPAATNAKQNGLTASMGANDAADLVNDIVGPTTDLAAEAQRIDQAWPAMSTLPGTDIFTFKSHIIYDEDNEQWSQQTEVNFHTTLSSQDAVLAIQTELAQNVDGEVTNSTGEDQDGIPTYSAEVGMYHIFSGVDRDVTYVSIRKNGAGDEAPASEAQVQSVAGIAEDSFVDGQANTSLQSLSIEHSLGRTSVKIVHRLDNTSEAEAATVRDDGVAAAGWEVARDGLVPEYNVPGMEAHAEIFLREEDFDGLKTFLRIEFLS